MNEYQSEEYKDLVASYAKGQHITKRDYNILTANPKKWKAVLVHLKREVEIQLSIQKSKNVKYQELVEAKDNNITQKNYNQYITNVHTWKANAMRFIAAIELNISEAKDLIESNQNEQEGSIYDLNEKPRRTVKVL